MATTVPADAQVRHATLTSAIRAMFPHPSFPDGPYERSAEKIAAAAANDVRSGALLERGLDELHAAGFEDLGDDAKLAHLRSMEATPFFAFVRAEVITSLYDDREVWELLGYQGESFSQGGYVGRGFDDLDWLPKADVGAMRS